MVSVDSQWVEGLRVRNSGGLGPKWVHLDHSFQGSGGIVGEEQKEGTSQRIVGLDCKDIVLNLDGMVAGSMNSVWFHCRHKPSGRLSLPTSNHGRGEGLM